MIVCLTPRNQDINSIIKYHIIMYFTRIWRFVQEAMFRGPEQVLDAARVANKV